MKMDEVANSGNDEFYTPEYAITPLLKYISQYKTIWCPFDMDDSLFVKIFRKESFKVINTHISQGFNFFDIDIADIPCDIIISNPPYSIKYEVFEKLFNFGKPFAMLVGVVGLFESQKRFNLFKTNDFEIMYFNKRISYFKNYNDPKPSLNPPFSSVYITKNILPNKIIFEEITK